MTSKGIPSVLYGIHRLAKHYQMGTALIEVRDHPEQVIPLIR